MLLIEKRRVAHQDVKADTLTAPQDGLNDEGVVLGLLLGVVLGLLLAQH